MWVWDFVGSRLARILRAHKDFEGRTSEISFLYGFCYSVPMIIYLIVINSDVLRSDLEQRVLPYMSVTPAQAGVQLF